MTTMIPVPRGPHRLKLRSEDYLRLDAAGAFADYGKTELLDGEIVYMNAQHRPHARIKSRLHILIAQALVECAPGLEAMVEGSILVSPHDVPEPDIVVTAEAEGEGLIPLASVRLVVEIADATLRSDLKGKVAIYAGHGIPEYWVVDVNAAVVHRLWHPIDQDYVRRDVVAFGRAIASATLPGLSVGTERL